MKDPYRASPMLGATLIFLGAVLLTYAAYFFFDSLPQKVDRNASLATAAALGYFLWIVGSILVARARFSSTKAGLICGLFLLPGLIALLTTVRTLTRQEIWQRANRDFTPREQQRQYRNYKSLY